MKITNSSAKAFLTASMAVGIVLAAGIFTLAFSSGSHGQGVHNTWLTVDSYKVLNFVALIIGGFFLARKPVRKFFSSRTKGIEKELADLEQKKIEAEQSLAEYQEKFRNLDQESKQIVQDYIAQGEAAKAKILAQAKAQADKLEETAKHNIEQEFKAARKNLQRQVTVQAIEMAEQIIKDSITKEDQNKLIDQYLEKLDVKEVVA